MKTLTYPVRVPGTLQIAKMQEKLKFFGIPSRIEKGKDIFHENLCIDVPQGMPDNTILMIGGMLGMIEANH